MPVVIGQVWAPFNPCSTSSINKNWHVITPTRRAPPLSPPLWMCLPCLPWCLFQSLDTAESPCLWAIHNSIAPCHADEQASNFSPLQHSPLYNIPWQMFQQQHSARTLQASPWPAPFLASPYRKKFSGNSAWGPCILHLSSLFIFWPLKRQLYISITLFPICLLH